MPRYTNNVVGNVTAWSFLHGAMPLASDRDLSIAKTHMRTNPPLSIRPVELFDCGQMGLHIAPIAPFVFSRIID